MFAPGAPIFDQLKDKPGGVSLAAHANIEFAIGICLLGADEPPA